MRATACILLSAVLLAGCSAGDPDPTRGTTSSVPPATTSSTGIPSAPSLWPGEFPSYNGFEKELAGWEPKADVPRDPQTGRPVAWDVTVARPGSPPSEWSARLSLAGRQGNGTVWLAKRLELNPGGSHDFQVSLRVYTPQGLPGPVADVVAYLGPEPPTAEADFPAAGQSSAAAFGGLRQPASTEAGWHEHRFSWRGTVPPSGALHLAAGISATAAAQVVLHVDDVDVT